MIIEVRTYRIKPGRRAEFIRLFETRAFAGMRALACRSPGRCRGACSRSAAKQPAELARPRDFDALES
jgi:hypothetical protein